MLILFLKQKYLKKVNKKVGKGDFEALFEKK